MFTTAALINKRKFIITWGGGTGDSNRLELNTSMSPHYEFSGGMDTSRGNFGGSFTPINSPVGRALLQQFTGISGYLDIRRAMNYTGPSYLSYDNVQCYIPLSAESWSKDSNGMALLALLKFILPKRESPVFEKISQKTKEWANSRGEGFMKDFWSTISSWTDKGSFLYTTVGEIYGLDVPKQFLIKNQVNVEWYGQRFERVFISKLEIKFPESMTFVDSSGNLIPQYITVNVGFTSARVTALSKGGDLPYMGWLGSTYNPSPDEDNLDSTETPSAT